MTRAAKTIGFVLVALFGIYGCSKGPGTASTPVSESRSFYSNNHNNPNARIVRLEEDFKAAAADRDSLRQKLAAAEDLHVKLRKQLDETRLEGESLRSQLVTCGIERDEVKVQYESFRRSIKEVLRQAEEPQPAPIPAAAINSSITPANPN